MRLGKIVLGAVLALAPTAAEAAPRTVALVPNPVFSLADAWYAAGCDPDYEQGPLNGRDSIVMTYHGQAFQLHWSARAIVEDPPFVLEAVGPDCEKIGVPVAVSGPLQHYFLPPGTRWLVLHNRGAVGATVVLS